MRYVFCDYTLDTQRYELRDAETLVALRARVVDLLAYLIAHRDRVVPRQELLDQLWPDQFVGESALSSCIKAARQAVGDDGRTQRIIQTVHGRGFRFIAAVTVEDATLPLGEAGVAVPPPAPETSDQPPALLVGREAAFTQLHQWYATASRGWRQVGFITLFYRAEFGSARLHLQRCLALYDPLQHRSLAFLYGQDPEVAGLSFLAWTLWLLGYPDQALARAEEAIRRAQALSHPFSLAYALTWAAVIRQHRQEVQATQERAEAVITLSTAQGFTHLLAFGTILRSWARVGQGQRDGSMAQMRRGLDAWRATGAGLHQPYFLGLLATSAAQYGHADDGLQNLLEAIALAEALGERWWASEIYRLKGEFLLAREDTGREDTGKEEAQSCLLKALDIARQQQAKVLELRAAMSLGRLWQQQGRRDEARQLLAPIYDWFTEGFDTVDLQEAQLLLEALDT